MLHWVGGRAERSIHAQTRLRRGEVIIIIIKSSLTSFFFFLCKEEECNWAKGKREWCWPEASKSNNPPGRSILSSNLYSFAALTLVGTWPRIEQGGRTYLFKIVTFTLEMMTSTAAYMRRVDFWQTKGKPLCTYIMDLWWPLIANMGSRSLIAPITPASFLSFLLSRSSKDMRMKKAPLWRLLDSTYRCTF